MSYITCPKCGSEYYLDHIKFPFKDEGSSVACTKCGEILYRWGKGTDDYRLIPIEELRKQQEKERERIERAPLCPKCKIKMVLKYGSYGWFWSCPKYPNCKNTLNIRSTDKDLL